MSFNTLSKSAVTFLHGKESVSPGKLHEQLYFGHQNEFFMHSLKVARYLRYFVLSQDGRRKQ